MVEKSAPKFTPKNAPKNAPKTKPTGSTGLDIQSIIGANKFVSMPEIQQWVAKLKNSNMGANPLPKGIPPEKVAVLMNYVIDD